MCPPRGAAGARRLRSVSFATLLTLAAGCAHPPPPPPSKPAAKKLPAPAHLPEGARVLLRDLMQGHGADMHDLLWSILFLDYKSVVEIGQTVADGPLLSRPTDDETLNASLPERFFELQKELKASALDIITAAETEDAEQVAEAYGHMASTCVRCHDTYLRFPPAREPGFGGEGEPESD